MRRFSSHGLIVLLFVQWDIIPIDPLDLIPHLAKQTALKRLSEKICYHLTRWHIFDVNLSVLNFIRNKEVADADVSSSFLAGPFAIALEEDASFVVLINSTTVYLVSLALQEILRP